MAKITLIEDEELIAIVLNDEDELHPNGRVYPVCYVGYGDDIQMYCSEAWVEDQRVIEVIEDYEGDTDFEALYDNVMLPRMSRVVA